MKKNIDLEEVKEDLKQLEKLTRKMKLPAFRRIDIRWLEKKMTIKNSENKNFEKANVLVKKLYDQGIR